MSTPDPKEALQRAINIVGSQTALAERIGCNQPDVSYWLKHARRIPVERVPAISEATGGRVKKYELRPDFFRQDEQAA